MNYVIYKKVLILMMKIFYPLSTEKLHQKSNLMRRTEIDNVRKQVLREMANNQ